MSRNADIQTIVITLSSILHLCIDQLLPGGRSTFTLALIVGTLDIDKATEHRGIAKLSHQPSKGGLKLRILFGELLPLIAGGQHILPGASQLQGRQWPITTGIGEAPGFQRQGKGGDLDTAAI